MCHKCLSYHVFLHHVLLLILVQCSLHMRAGVQHDLAAAGLQPCLRVHSTPACVLSELWHLTAVFVALCLGWTSLGR
jgi:hypothetical protein